MTVPILREHVERNILLIRGHRVMLDTDLAKLYGVPTKVLNQAVKRNATRFPADFMFQLTSEETAALRSQIVTSKSRGGRQYRPYAFTEQGMAMPLAYYIASARLTHTIHDGSSRNRAVAKRDGRAEPRGREAYSKQYVDRPSDEPARPPAHRKSVCRLVAAANPRLQ
jgi:hypothetical protein